MRISYYIISFFFIFNTASYANSEKIISNQDNIKIEERNESQEFLNYLNSPNEKTERFFDTLSQSPSIIKLKNLTSFVFGGQNAAFQDKNHMISLSYGDNVSANGHNMHYLSGRYSIPVNLFMNGRASIEVGGILGNSNYVGGNNTVNQVIVGLMYEGVFNFNYFYVTGGIGPYYRNENHSTIPGDGIGSKFVFGAKLAIGKTFFQRYNLEFVYRHFSNGELEVPNTGYNFLGIEASIRF